MQENVVSLVIYSVRTMTSLRAERDENPESLNSIGLFWELDYGPYGELLRDTAPGLVPFGYAGGLYDEDTGLVHFGWRDYDPQVGQWLSKEPLLFGGGSVYLYGYAHGDPLGWVDPDGRDGGRAPSRRSCGAGREPGAAFARGAAP